MFKSWQRHCTFVKPDIGDLYIQTTYGICTYTAYFLFIVEGLSVLICSHLTCIMFLCALSPVGSNFRLECTIADPQKIDMPTKSCEIKKHNIEDLRFPQLIKAFYNIGT